MRFNSNQSTQAADLAKRKRVTVPRLRQQKHHQVASNIYILGGGSREMRSGAHNTGSVSQARRSSGSQRLDCPTETMNFECDSGK